MFKTRYKAWGFLITLFTIIVIFIFLGSKIVFSQKLIPYVTTRISPHFNAQFSKIYTQQSTYITDDTNVIIQDTSDKVYDGFTKYSKEYYSPIVMFGNSQTINPDSGFSNIGDDHSKQVMSMNFSYIVKAMTENKTWQDINVNKNVVEGPISFVIPSKSNPAYQSIKSLFVNSLDGNEELANKLLEKCTEIDDVGTYINSHATEKFIALSPEYIVALHNVFLSSSENLWVPIYTQSSEVIYWDLFVKENTTDYEKVHDSLVEDSMSIFSYVGIRCIEATFGMNGVSYNFYHVSDYFVL